MIILIRIFILLLVNVWIFLSYYFVIIKLIFFLFTFYLCFCFFLLILFVNFAATFKSIRQLKTYFSHRILYLSNRKPHQLINFGLFVQFQRLIKFRVKFFAVLRINGLIFNQISDVLNHTVEIRCHLLSELS